MNLTENPTEAAELCESIADLIDTHGFAVGWYTNREGGMCLVGAGRKALRLEGFSTTHIDKEGCLDCHIARVLGFYSCRKVYTFNDHDGIDGYPLGKERAVDYAISRAKFWRNR